MYTSYHIIQTVVCYCHRNILNVIIVVSVILVDKTGLSNSFICVVTLATSNIVLNTSNNDVRVRKHFTKAKHVRFMLYMYTV